MVSLWTMLSNYGANPEFPIYRAGHFPLPKSALAPSLVTNVCLRIWLRWFDVFLRFYIFGAVWSPWVLGLGRARQIRFFPSSRGSQFSWGIFAKGWDLGVVPLPFLNLIKFVNFKIKKEENFIEDIKNNLITCF